ncbi:MAG: hypothetical protein ABIK28_08375 [Planctomycetota bacterium]
MNLPKALLLIFCLFQDEDPVQINNEAVKLMKEGCYDLAVRKLVIAHNLDPEDEQIHENLATSYAQRGIYEGNQGNYYVAVEDLREAARHAPKKADFRYYQAIFLYRMNELALAEDNVLLALKLTTADELILNLKKLEGNILYLDDHLAASLDIFQEVVKRDDSDADAIRMIEKIRREVTIQKEYTQDITPYFRVLYGKEALNVESDGPLICLMEEERSRVCTDFNYFPRNRTTVIIYNPEDFKAVTEAESWVGGLFDRKIRIPLSDVNQNADAIAQVVRHEYSHVIVHELAPGCPAFVNEGIACYEQFPEGTGKRRLKSMMQQGCELIPFERMPRSFLQIPDHDQVKLCYAQSHALVEYIISRYGFWKIRLLLRELKKKGDWQAAFQSAFNMSFATVEGEWLEAMK